MNQTLVSIAVFGWKRWAVAASQTRQGRGAEMLPKRAEAAGVAPGSIVVLHLNDEGISAQILLAVTDETKMRNYDKPLQTHQF